MLACSLPSLLAAGRVVNQEAVALSPTIGWLLLACATVFALILLLNGDRVRRLWLRTEDPRTIGLFRVLFALFVLFNVNGLWEHFTFLFTDEGIFFSDTARELLAKKQFAGFGDPRAGEAAGFFDWAAIVEFLKGPKWSVLLLWDSPTAFWAQLAVFEVVTVLFAVGYKSRLMGVLSYLLMRGMFDRNPLFMEGTDAVYLVFFFYLLLSRCGDAYSVDNWLRCRRLRRQGRLSEPGGPGNGAGAPPPAGPNGQGLEAIYRRIPAWPRLLMMLQLATIYLFTGSAKTGEVWLRGDTLYYALNMDHFYRVPTQYLSQVFGTNAFRVMTWVVHVWQICFFVVIIGVILRWAVRQEFAPLPRARRWAVRLLWIALGLLALAVAEVAWPVHFKARAGGPTLAQVQWIFGACWLALMAVIAWGYQRLRYRPFQVRLGGRTRTLDLTWFCSWFLGRRVWLTLGLLFHGHIMVLMNIGMFAPIMMMTYLCFLSGPETATILRRLGALFGRLGVPGLRRLVDDARPLTPAEDPSLPRLHHDGARIPDGVIGVAVASFVAAAIAKASGASGLAITLAIAGLSALLAAGLWARVNMGKRPPVVEPWAYGPLGRLLAGGFVAFHITAVAVWVLPQKDCLSTFRHRAADPFRDYLSVTRTAQSWNMFAPNPPRSNVFLKVLVTDQDGKVFDLNTDVYAEERKPIPWIWNDRLRKMNRRITGKRDGKNSFYQKWHARYFCRDWALQHAGREPEKVELVKV
ncbi:MAG: hypothetical protein R3A51_23115, partial [Nannocystaceae bacterium]